MSIVQVVESFLEEDPDRFGFSLADPGRVDMTAANVDEASDVADDLAKRVRTLPSHCEGADASRAVATNGSVFGLGAETIGLGHFGQNFGE